MLRMHQSLCCFSFTAMLYRCEFIYALWVLVPFVGIRTAWVGTWAFASGRMNSTLHISE